VVASQALQSLVVLGVQCSSSRLDCGTPVLSLCRCGMNRVGYGGSGGSGRSHDWKCGSCQFSNFAFRDICLKCNSSKGDGISSGGGGRSGGSSRSRDWECGSCQFSNFAFREKCLNCNISKPNGEKKNGTLLLPPRNLQSSGRVYYTWKPNDIYEVFPLYLNSEFNEEELMGYTHLDNLSHVEHFEDFEFSQEQRKFFPYELSYMSNSHLHDLKVMWFGPKKNASIHNWYGNVSYTVSMGDFMNLMKAGSINIYFVEIVDFKFLSVSRYLFSYKEHDLDHYNPTERGGTWYVDSHGDHNFLESLRRFNASEDVKSLTHELEIMLELRNADYSKLFNLCKTEAVNHSDANEMNDDGRPKRMRCKKYYTSDCGEMKEMCPSSWSVRHTEKQMNKIKQENIDSDLDSDSESDALNDSIPYSPSKKRFLSLDSDSDSDSMPDSPSKKYKNVIKHYEDLRIEGYSRAI
ncbi:unnamed protein product, partial [Meganyctiphanes norvegica]